MGFPRAFATTTCVRPESSRDFPLLLPRVPKVTVQPVLGHHFEHLVRDGVVNNYAEIALRTGLTRASDTQITNLRLLAPKIQEETLLLPAVEVVERRPGGLTADPDWFQ